MDIPPELVLDILQRLPWTSCRRLRLVCRLWRDLVHQHTTEMQQRRDAVPLLVTTESAYVVDLEEEEEEESIKTTLLRELCLGHGAEYMEVVGVCNGVICMCDDATSGGAITLVNPATGDVLALPPMPRHGLFRRHNTRCSGRSWHQAYSFGYHHVTGLYKVVHVPCFFKTKDVVNVFTLGEASWREVSAPTYAKCKLDAGLVSVNGATYWVADGSVDRIMCFDLQSEQVTCTKPLPMAARPIRDLTEVHRRLGVATATTTNSSYYANESIQVWILETRRKEQTWIHLYELASSPARPYFIHGKRVRMDKEGNLVMYQHKPLSYYDRKSGCTVVHDNARYRKIVASNVRGSTCGIFPYIKTEDALSVYRRW